MENERNSQEIGFYRMEHEGFFKKTKREYNFEKDVDKEYFTNFVGHASMMHVCEAEEIYLFEITISRTYDCQLYAISQLKLGRIGTGAFLIIANYRDKRPEELYEINNILYIELLEMSDEDCNEAIQDIFGKNRFFKCLLKECIDEKKLQSM
ncbi:TPA_asm: hypothetical protein [Altiarchaeum virus]|nr:TPA_asm: hypothetical protein [Altiarchaeum virus]